VVWVSVSLWAGIFFIALGSVFYFKSTRLKQTRNNHLMAFFVGPMLLIPLLGAVYLAAILLPIYSLAP
jgi:hypothetical protein